MTEKERSAAKFRARVEQEQLAAPRRNADGRTRKGQRALERAARLTYQYDRDFEYETPDDSA